jgi:transcription initiation factor TFIID subunit TAF12
LISPCAECYFFVLQFKVQAFFQKTRKKSRSTNHGENDPALDKEQAKCRKLVKTLVKRRKLTEAQKLVQQEIEMEEWGTEAQVKVRYPDSVPKTTEFSLVCFKNIILLL